MNKQDYGRYIILTAMAEHPELWSLAPSSADAVQWAAESLTERKVCTGTAPTDTWRGVATAPPDDETTVLISVAYASEPVWVGYCEDGRWYTSEGEPCEPSHWMYLPTPHELPAVTKHDVA